MNIQPDLLSSNYLFPSTLYFIDKPNFITDIGPVVDGYLDEARKDVKPEDYQSLVQSANFPDDPKVSEFVSYIAQTSWNLLQEQGFDMEKSSTFVSEMWAQEHSLGSGHSEHVHSHGAQLTGFYVIDAPDNSSKFMFHDPRSGKRQIHLLEKDNKLATIASNAISYTPVKGQFYFFNSYIPHEITRNVSTDLFKIIHFNVSVFATPPVQTTSTAKPAEII